MNQKSYESNLWALVRDMKLALARKVRYPEIYDNPKQTNALMLNAKTLVEAQLLLDEQIERIHQLLADGCRIEPGELLIRRSCGPRGVSDFFIHDPKTQMFIPIRRTRRYEGPTVMIKDEGAKLVYGNRDAEQLTGRPLSRMIGATSADLFPGESGQKILESDRRVLQNNKMIGHEKLFAQGKWCHRFSTRFPLTMDLETHSITKMAVIGVDLRRLLTHRAVA